MPPVALVILICLPALLSLVCGITLMAVGGDMNRKYGVKLMRMRVYTQGFAIIAAMIAAASY